MTDIEEPAPIQPTQQHQQPGGYDDPVVESMGRVVGALRRFSGHTSEVLEAFDRAIQRLESGSSYRDVVAEENLFVDFTEGPLKELLDALTDFRRRQAQALYDDGMTMAQLGRLLGVTRQRVAVLLGAKRSRT